MKKQGETHPKYQQVLFVDTSTGSKFVCGTTLRPEETEKFEGKEYPVYRVPISSSSHPLFTGSQQFIDTEGRVDKFRKRYAAKPAVAPETESALPSVKASERAATKKKKRAATKKK